jgi:hypothetical protein
MDNNLCVHYQNDFRAEKVTMDGLGTLAKRQIVQRDETIDALSKLVNSFVLPSGNC